MSRDHRDYIAIGAGIISLALAFALAEGSKAALLGVVMTALAVVLFGLGPMEQAKVRAKKADRLVDEAIGALRGIEDMATIRGNLDIAEAAREARIDLHKKEERAA